MAKRFGIICEYKDKIDLVKKILSVHLALFPPKKKLHKLEKEALAYYIIYGYNDDTVEDIETNLTKDINRSYARSINSTLRKKGFLFKDKYNKNKSHLSEEMERYRSHIKKGDYNFLPIVFSKK